MDFWHLFAFYGKYCGCCDLQFAPFLWGTLFFYSEWTKIHILLKKHKKLYNIEGLFGQNEQDLVKMLWFVSCTRDVNTRWVGKQLVNHNIIPNVVSVGSLGISVTHNIYHHQLCYLATLHDI